MEATKYQIALAEYLKRQGLSLELASTIPSILVREELDNKKAGGSRLAVGLFKPPRRASI
jgi:hypothetical protein